jgi:hypothetical protein
MKKCASVYDLFSAFLCTSHEICIFPNLTRKNLSFNDNISKQTYHKHQASLIKLATIGCTHRQQGDLISLLTKIRAKYTDRWMDKERQQGDLISLLTFFLNKESNEFQSFVDRPFPEKHQTPQAPHVLNAWAH